MRDGGAGGAAGAPAHAGQGSAPGPGSGAQIKGPPGRCSLPCTRLPAHAHTPRPVSTHAHTHTHAKTLTHQARRPGLRSPAQRVRARPQMAHTARRGRTRAPRTPALCGQTSGRWVRKPGTRTRTTCPAPPRTQTARGRRPTGCERPRRGPRRGTHSGLAGAWAGRARAARPPAPWLNPAPTSSGKTLTRRAWGWRARRGRRARGPPLAREREGTQAPRRFLFFCAVREICVVSLNRYSRKYSTGTHSLSLSRQPHAPTTPRPCPQRGVAAG
jgi:hypothetical protein